MSGRAGRPPFEGDDLRAMLEERAGRLERGAEREVMSGVRAALTGPGEGRGTRVPSLVPAGRSIAMPAGWAIVGLAAVLVLAMLGSRLGAPAEPPGSAGSVIGGSVGAGGSRGPAASSAGSPAPTSSPSPQASLEAIVGRIELTRFRLALASGALDGRLVLLGGTLERVALPCPSGDTAPCVRLSIAGLEGVPVGWDGPIVDDPFAGQRATLAVVPRAGTLELLGRVVGNPDDPPPVYDWRERFGTLATPYDVHALAGWLVIGGLHSCPMLGPGATPCPGPGPLLTDKQPFADGVMTSDLQLPVVVATGAPGIDPSRVVTGGPFLARESVTSTCPREPMASFASCAGGRIVAWTIVARYDPDTVVRVDLP